MTPRVSMMATAGSLELHEMAGADTGLPLVSMTAAENGMVVLYVAVSVGAEMMIDLKGPTTGDVVLSLLQLASRAVNAAKAASAAGRITRFMGDSVRERADDRGRFLCRLGRQSSRGPWRARRAPHRDDIQHNAAKRVSKSRARPLRWSVAPPLPITPDRARLGSRGGMGRNDEHDSRQSRSPGRPVSAAQTPRLSDRDWKVGSGRSRHRLGRNEPPAGHDPSSRLWRGRMAEPRARGKR